jgi:hypothetical protein
MKNKKRNKMKEYDQRERKKKRVSNVEFDLTLRESNESIYSLLTFLDFFEHFFIVLFHQQFNLSIFSHLID